MRIRSTKPEFWRSQRVASVSWDARLVLKGLESYVDDNGVGKDDLALIVADVFPRDLSRNPPGTLQKVSEALDALSEAGLLWRYEADGTPLLYIAFWESIQRIEKPSKGRFRRPDGTLDYRESEIREALPEPSRNPPGTLRPGTGEQGNRGTERTRPSADADDQAFDQWWTLYPRKVKKDAARRAFKAALKRATLEDLIGGLRKQLPALQSQMAKDPQFVAHPSTWLNSGSWADEPVAVQTERVPSYWRGTEDPT